MIQKYVPKKGEFFILKSINSSQPLFFCIASEEDMVTYRRAIFPKSDAINSVIGYTSFIEASGDVILGNIKNVLNTEYIEYVRSLQNSSTGVNHRIDNLLLIDTLKESQLKEIKLLTKLIMLRDNISFSTNELLDILYQFKITSVKKLCSFCSDIENTSLSNYLGDNISSEDLYRLAVNLNQGFYLKELFELLLSINLSDETVQKLQLSIGEERDYIKEIVNNTDPFPKHVVDELQDNELSNFFDNISDEHHLHLNVLRNVLKYFPVRENVLDKKVIPELLSLETVEENKQVFVKEYLTKVKIKDLVSDNGGSSTLSIIKTVINRNGHDEINCVIKFKDLGEDVLNNYYLDNPQFLYNYLFYHDIYEISIEKELTKDWVEIEN